MAGTIASIVNHGSIVTVVIDCEDGSMSQVHCDHRMFGRMYEGEGGNIIGRSVEVSGDFCEEVIKFTD